MSGSPWISVIAIGGGVLAVFLFLLLLLKLGGLRNGLTSPFRWPLFAAVIVGGFGASALMLGNGTGGNPFLALLLAMHLFQAADAPRQAWARWLIWLDAAVLAGVPAILWLDGSEFSNGSLLLKVVTVLMLSVVLWSGRASFLNIYRPKSFAASETGTPA